MKIVQVDKEEKNKEGCCDFKIVPDDEKK